MEHRKIDIKHTLIRLAFSIIIILGIISTIGLVSVASVRRKANDGMFRDKLDFVIAGAKNWGEENKNILYTDSDKTIEKTVGELIAGGFIESDDNNQIIYDNDKTSIDQLKVKVFINYNRVYACIDMAAAKNHSNAKIKAIPWDNFAGGDWFCN